MALQVHGQRLDTLVLQIRNHNIRTKLQPLFSSNDESAVGSILKGKGTACVQDGIIGIIVSGIEIEHIHI